MRNERDDTRDTWWTVAEVAAHCEVQVKTVQKWVREGLPMTLGHIRRVDALAEFNRRLKAKAATRRLPRNYA